ncbi:MAG TPA: phosphoenolpyruvate--protein phosphotransferase [Opitutaceae bacterium]|nr:phosphoenolpyruvate--protein phosphotransferase [Opitutaceae bacterium]
MDSKKKKKPEKTIHGIAASNGIAYGRAFLFVQDELDVPHYKVEPTRYREEVERFEKALVATRHEIAKVHAEVEKNLGPDEARIFDAHLLVLEDQALIGETIREFEKTSMNIETCFMSISQRYVAVFEKIDDDYLRERVSDIRDVARRLLANLLGRTAAKLGELITDRIVISNDISPSDAASIDRSSALGIVTEAGSRTSHAVIVARSMRIPAVVGIGALTDTVESDDMFIVDGYDGVVIVNPDETTLFRYGKLKEQKRTFESRVMSVNRLQSETLDGTRVPHFANIEKETESDLAIRYNAEGIGLYRTEYLFIASDDIPDEEAQFAAYRKVAETLHPRPVIIRTFDLGGDKVRSNGVSISDPEANPFLGFRAIRFCLEHKDLFRTQLRAILRASAFGNVRIMYPMISSAVEIVRAGEILDEARAELRKKNQKFDEKIAVGAMIEIPSAAFTIDLIAEHASFLSIGTNDLIQYLLAIDRVNSRIAHLYEPTHPAVIRTLQRIFADARKARIPVSICGEMAGDPVFAALLLGLGAQSLSMTPPLLPSVRYMIRHMKYSEARKLAKDALKMSDPKEIYAKFADFYAERTRELNVEDAEE